MFVSCLIRFKNTHCTHCFYSYKKGHIFRNDSFNDVFSDVSEILVISDRNVTTRIDPDIHRCIIIENQHMTQDDEQFSTKATFGNEE